MGKIIIATLFQKEPVLVSATRLGADTIYLLVDEEPKDKQKESLDFIKKSLKGVVDVKTIQVSPYKIVEIAKKVIDVLDKLSEKDQVIINVSSGRKTQSLGLLFAAYSRNRHISKIIYVVEEDHSIIDLPKLSFNLTDSQIRLLNEISKQGHKSLKELADNSDISRGMLYRNLKELQDLGLIKIEEESMYNLTDAGEIARL